jgi:uncharacterized membrane protein
MALMGLLKGLVVGAGAMYLLDPDQGNERCERFRQSFKRTIDSARRESGDWVRDFPPVGKGVICGGLLLAGVARRGLLGGAMVAGGIAGLVSLVRESSRSPRVSRGRAARHGGKSVRIQAPVERVFEFFMNPENFSRVIDRVAQVKNVGQGISHWTLDDEQWDAALTRVIPNERIEWHSTPGSPVESFGEVSCEPEDGGTLLHLSVVTRMPSGAEDELFEDLEHARSVIEQEILQTSD